MSPGRGDRRGDSDARSVPGTTAHACMALTKLFNQVPTLSFIINKLGDAERFKWGDVGRIAVNDKALHEKWFLLPQSTDFPVGRIPLLCYSQGDSWSKIAHNMVSSPSLLCFSPSYLPLSNITHALWHVCCLFPRIRWFPGGARLPSVLFCLVSQSLERTWHLIDSVKSRWMKKCQMIFLKTPS